MIGWESVEIIQSSEREDIGTEILVFLYSLAFKLSANCCGFSHRAKVKSNFTQASDTQTKCLNFCFGPNYLIL